MSTELTPVPARTKMIGRRFGKLVVESIARRGDNGRLFFRCVCDCGEVAEAVEACSLYNRKSCGCLKRRASAS